MSEMNVDVGKELNALARELTRRRLNPPPGITAESTEEEISTAVTALVAYAYGAADATHDPALRQLADNVVEALDRQVSRDEASALGSNRASYSSGCLVRRRSAFGADDGPHLRRQTMTAEVECGACKARENAVLALASSTSTGAYPAPGWLFQNGYFDAAQGCARAIAVDALLEAGIVWKGGV